MPRPKQGGEAKYEVSTIRLTPEQWDAVRKEASARALEKRSARPDTSEVLRDLVDAWRAKKRAK